MVSKRLKSKKKTRSSNVLRKHNVISFKHALVVTERYTREQLEFMDRWCMAYIDKNIKR